MTNPRSNGREGGCVSNIFSAAPRHSMKREESSIDQTFERTEVATLEVQIAAVRQMNEFMVAQLSEIRRERDDLREQRNYWRSQAIEQKSLDLKPSGPPAMVPKKRKGFWRKRT